MFQAIILAFIYVSCSTGIIQAMEWGTPSSASYHDSRQFDSESAHFSKMTTIKTWIADQYHADEKLMKRIQTNVAMTIPQNVFSIHFTMPIQNNKGDKRYFGKTFPTIAAMELPFLQFVRQKSETQAVATLEIGASIGLVSWKVPFAFKGRGTHYANELSRNMLEKAFETVITNRLEGTDLKQAIVKLPGDCFTLLSEHPDLEGKLDAIFVQNVEHFFNPIQHQEFLTLIEKLLEDGGQAFLCAHSFVWGVNKRNPLFKLYQKQKRRGRIYPGFAEFDVEFVQIKDKQAQLDHEITRAKVPSDDALCIRENIGGEPIELGEISHGIMGNVSLIKVKQKVISNAFSPEIYRKVIELHPTLQILDTFFINEKGEKVAEWGGSVRFAGVIVQKKAS